MQELDVDLPGGYPASLLYLMDSPTARGKPLEWLQDRQRKDDTLAAAYQKELGGVVAAFVRALTARPEYPPDVVLVPSPARRHFRPYLDGLIAATPGLVVVYGLFADAMGSDAEKNDQPFEEVAERVVLTLDPPPRQVHGAARVLILVDLYQTGNTAGAMLRRVRPYLAADPKVVVACPLYVPVVRRNAGHDVSDSRD